MFNMSSQASLSAASNDRKARLAQLKSLKRKQAPTSQDDDVEMSGAGDATSTSIAQEAAQDATTDAFADTTSQTAASASVPSNSRARKRSRSRSVSPSLETTRYLSGRNYDPSTRGPKLGFETAPASNVLTVEARAAALAAETNMQREEEEKADRPLDLFKLQPKRPNWDLKRDLEKKLKVLDVRTDNAIARLVRERIEGAKAREMREVGSKTPEEGDGEVVGMEGTTLVEAMHQREREEVEDEKRERALEVEDAV